MTIDIDNLLGGPAAPPSRRRARAPKPAAPPPEITDETIDLSDVEDSTILLKQRVIHQASIGRAFIEVNELRRPVSVSFLANAFAMSPDTVKKRLRDCPAIGNGGGNRPVYDFRTACGYLIPPKMRIEEYIRSIDPNELPNYLNKVFWEAQRIKIKAMLEAGDAWPTEDVLDVFGRAFMDIKSRTQLWMSALREDPGMTTAQGVRLSELVDKLLNSLYEKLVKAPTEKRTRSMAASISAHGEAGG